MSESARVLVMEGGEGGSPALERILQRSGFAAQVERDGLIGLHRALHEPYDLIILDVLLPGIDGFAALEQLRRESDVPVLVLTSLGSTQDRVRGLQIGADDCLSRPFEPEELLARIGAILRRTSSPTARATGPLIVGELTLFPAAGDAFLGSQRLPLTPMETEILEQLMRAAGRPVSRDQLSLLLYRRPASAFDRAVDTHINRIRRKLGERAGLILSIRGTGYQLRCPAHPGAL